MLVSYGMFYYWYIAHVTEWYFSVPVTTVPDTAFVTGTITAIGGMLTIFSNNYIKSGRAWGEYKKYADD